jgi:hypothetical protein
MNAGHWQSCLAFGLVLFLLLPLSRTKPVVRAGALVLALAVGFLPVGGLPLAAYPRSVVDDLAITTMIALGAVALLRVRGAPTIGADHRFEIALFFAVLALLLYPATLGLSQIDPYGFGYLPRSMIAAALVAALVFWWRRNYFGAIMLAGATLAFGLDIKASDNYWDYLIDPALALYCFGVLILHIWRVRFPRAPGAGLRQTDPA